ncbi:MAG: site-2 protease family protein [Candidatus Methanospirare jalkutatii]|nr:site-2 protease family protein [Candidatus Methanospirare jalkutatii]MCW7080210.1 site-2 protease family protein [Candidatus Methanospirare jalkutatii]
MEASLQVCQIRGIPIRLHFSFLLIFFIFVVAEPPFGFGGNFNTQTRLGLAAAATFLLFASLLMHELSHSLLAMRYGTKIQGITLFLFGGVAMMEDMPREPSKEWRVAIAGPAMSIAIGTPLFLASFIFKAVSPTLKPLSALAESIGLLNIFLAAFNLMPAFPMDGGRMLRAFLAERMPFLDATKKAVLVGKVFAVLMGIAGIMNPLALAHGRIEILNPWLTLIAIFLFIAASEEERATEIFAALEGVKVADVMRAGSAGGVPASATVEDVFRRMLSERCTEFAVVSEEGRVLGFLHFRELKEMPAEKREFLRAEDALPSTAEEAKLTATSVSASEDAVAALKRMLRERKSILAVVDDEGKFKGIITKKDIAHFVEMLRG